MPLPGKYCFGILEEDNPTKSYFRFKPLLIETEGKYEPFTDAEAYPENGCLRIVPDKNESSHFKARMRRMGRYAVVDLREHPEENDKIRPNKNYHGDGAEQNANIIYSDVVREPLPGSVLEILSLEVPEESSHMALTLPLPGTRHILVRGDDGALNPYVWTCEALADIENGVDLYRTEISSSVEGAGSFELSGFAGEKLCFVLAAPGERLVEIAEEARQAAQEEKLAQKEKPAPAAAEAEVTHQEEPAVKAEEETAVEPSAPAKEPERVSPPAPAAKEKPAGGGRNRGEQPARGGRMSPHDQALMLQSGLNPRRGRSLQEIIEDKWRHSRLDQLGHPVPGEATGQPVVSPVERAVFAVREAWAQPEARAGLRAALAGIDGFAAIPAPEGSP